MCRDDVRVFAFCNSAGFPSQTLLRSQLPLAARPRPMPITAEDADNVKQCRQRRAFSQVDFGSREISDPFQRFRAEDRSDTRVVVNAFVCQHGAGLFTCRLVSLQRTDHQPLD